MAKKNSSPAGSPGGSGKNGKSNTGSAHAQTKAASSRGSSAKSSRKTSSASAKRGASGGSGKRTASSKQGTRGAGTSARKKEAVRKARENGAQRRRDIQLDIAIIVLLALMLILFLALCGFGGSVGEVLSDILFGVFGITAWGVPVYIFVFGILMLRGGSRRGRRFLWCALFLFLIAQIAAHLVLHQTNAVSLEIPFTATEAFRFCAEHHQGGGVIGGWCAMWLYRAFGVVVSSVILAVAAIIDIFLLLDRSPAVLLRSWREEHTWDEGPGLRERIRMRKEQEQEEREREEEERWNREADRILRREDRRNQRSSERERLERLQEQKGGEGRAKKRRTARTSDMDLENIRLRSREEHFRETGGYAMAGSRADGHRSAVIREEQTRDMHEIRVLPADRRDPLTIPSSGRNRTRMPDPDGTRYVRPNRDGVPENSPEIEMIPSAERRSENGMIPAAEPAGPTAPASASAFTAPGNRKGASAFTGRGSLEGKFSSGKSGNMEEIRPSGERGNVEEILPSGNHRNEEEIFASGNHRNVEEILSPGNRGNMKETGSEGGKVPADPGNSPVSGKTGSASGARSPVRIDANRSDAPSEEALEGIQVHREEGTDTGRIGRAAVTGRKKSYHPPRLDLLEAGNGGRSPESERELKETAYRLQETLRTFGVNVTITDISQGPAVTRYELLPDKGVKVSRIVHLSDDIKLRLAATEIRIEAPIPGKSAIGIEVPNKHKTTVHLRELLDSAEFRGSKGKLPFTVGKDIGGKTVIADIARMPHLLIAGATGSGKSVCINTIILSILYKTTPEDVRLLMIDPKVVELSVYKGIPHLIIPVVTDARKASAALNWAVAEMEKRYKLFAAAGVRDLNGYNTLARTWRGDDGEPERDPLPRLVIIVDELADLMMVSKNEVESAICRLAQLARAAGIHLIIATQRPSVDVITGLIKANMPSRIAFAVSSQVDSRTILDMGGAEKLVGQGDMLFYPQNYQKPARMQGAFVSDEDVTKVVDYVRKHNSFRPVDTETASEDIDRQIEKIAADGPGAGTGPADRGGQSRDALFEEAGRYIIENNKASIGHLQRIYKIGFNRAARIMDQLAEAGVVSVESSTRARQVLMTMPEFEMFLEGE